MKHIQYSILGLITSLLTIATPSLPQVNPVFTGDDEKIRCVIRDDDGNVISSCWFCDCEDVQRELDLIAEKKLQ